MTQQLCIKLTKGECPYRNGIYCNAYICARDNPKSTGDYGFGKDFVQTLGDIFGFNKGFTK